VEKILTSVGEPTCAQHDADEEHLTPAHRENRSMKVSFEEKIGDKANGGSGAYRRGRCGLDRGRGELPPRSAICELDSCCWSIDDNELMITKRNMQETGCCAPVA
jgi:hypothetical protein